MIDVPHLRERTCNDSILTSTSVLTVDNFQSSDDGIYQCTAVSGNSTGEGGSTELKGIIIIFHILSHFIYYPKLLGTKSSRPRASVQ